MRGWRSPHSARQSVSSSDDFHNLHAPEFQSVAAADCSGRSPAGLRSPCSDSSKASSSSNVTPELPARKSVRLAAQVSSDSESENFGTRQSGGEGFNIRHSTSGGDRSFGSSLSVGKKTSTRSNAPRASTLGFDLSALNRTSAKPGNLARLLSFNHNHSDSGDVPIRPSASARGSVKGTRQSTLRRGDTAGSRHGADFGGFASTALPRSDTEKTAWSQGFGDGPSSRRVRESAKSSNVHSEPRMKSFARKIVSSKVFIALTTVLTIYALIGDDIRVMATNKPADDFFNWCTLICMAVFSFEIIMSCLGRDDYIWGFFMALDVISTITLVLDLTYVADLVMGDGENLEQMRSGRTARVGAKAGRVVRVIRLVRILKLYKALHESRQKNRRRKTKLEEEWDDIDATQMEEKKNQGLQQSRVGKKLSDLTIRRVIILVLTMLLVLPFLRTQGSDSIPPSSYYGADEVYEAWLEHTESPDWLEGRLRYEHAVLRYLYYHNWFTGQADDCPILDSGCSNWYYSHVFWVGIVSSEETIIQHKVNSTQLRLSTVQEWNTQAGSQNDIYNFGAMPDEVLPIIAGEWTTCNDEVKGIFRRGFSLLQKEISSNVDYAVPCPKQLRNTEKSKFYPRLVPLEKYKEWHFAFYFDTRPFSRSEAMFGLIITIFICVVLSIASLQFSADANRLVLAPVEHMIMTVETIRKNPLIAMRMADDEFRLEEKTRAKLQHAPAHHALQAKLKETCCSSSSGQEPMETVVLEKTIIKLGSLLALGFGEAGAGIIEQNLSHSDSVGVHVMIPGSKVECIIGKAQVNNFSTATEVLQGKVMTFVNQIAEIVHGVVDEYHGAANKNNGDTFLVVWRTQSPSEEVYAEELFSQDEVGTNVRVAPSKSADMSLMAFAKILGAVHRAPVLAAYRAHPGLQQRLDSRCRVSLSFGLHAGWAIEGAVGSEFKIDASYLSPNVSIVSTVEAATKVYDVPILVSQSVVELGSSGMAAKCRLIDRVIIRGSTTPVGLYALDLDFECLTVQAPFDPKIQWNLRQRFKARQVLEIEKTRLLQPEVEIIKEFENNPDICAMRHLYTMEFLQMFHMGFENYTHGEWEVAERFFSDTQSMLSRWSTDGPSSALLRFMEKHNCIAPDGWNGVRELSVGVQ